MHSTESIITVHGDWLDDLTLAISTVDVFLNSDIDIDHVFDAHKVVESELMLAHLLLIVLLHSSSIDLVGNNTEGVEFGVFGNLNLELWQDERELSKLRLSLVSDGDAHALEDSWLMELVRLHDSLFIFLNLRVEVRLCVTVELPDVNAIVLSCGDNHVVVKGVEH